ncbi:MAG: DUF2586 family protein [Flavipsychrobacter sp.]
MGQPKVVVNITNNAMGGAPANEDGLSALMVTATAVTGLGLLVPAQVYSLNEAVALGITAAATPFAYRQIKGFYDGYNFITGSQRAPLYIMTAADTVTLAQMADQTNASGLKKLLDFANGRVRLAGVARNPAIGYTPTVTNGVDADSLTALDNAHTLATTCAASNNPLRVFVEQRAFLYANVASLLDMSTKTSRRALPVIGSQLNDGSADVGFMLGVAAGIKVNQSMGRVKFGAITAFTQAYIGDKKVEEFTAIDTLHDKGYVYFRTIPNRSGYYINGDRMACATTDDYCYLHRGRVIDKAQRIVARVYTEWLNDDVETISGGRLAPAVVDTLENILDTAVRQEMAGEISEYETFIDPEYNVVSNGKIKVVGEVRTRFVILQFEMDLGLKL